MESLTYILRTCHMLVLPYIVAPNSVVLHDVGECIEIIYV